MRILVYGAGNIGRLYAALLKESGQEVSILARGRRLAEIREQGIRLEDVATGTRITSRVRAVECLGPEDAYDVVLVILPKENVSEVLPILGEHRHTPTLVFFGNNAAGSGQLAEALGHERVMLGFPGASAISRGHTLRYLILSRREQPTTLGELDGRSTDRLEALAAALEAAGFPVATCSDMAAWLKTHAAEIVPTATALYASAGDIDRLRRTPDALLLMLRAIREIFRALSKVGVSITPRVHRVFRWIPEPLLLRVTRRRLSGEDWELKIGHALAARREMETLSQELREATRASGIPTPSLDSLSRYLDPEVEPLPEGSAEIRRRWGAVWGLVALLLALAMAVLLGITARGPGRAPTAAPETARTIAQGEVVGFVAENGAHVWRGLPYAASTAGEGRWRPPRPAPAWEGVREALHFADRCAQLTNEFDRDEGLEPGLVVGSEDCLALDIYSPADSRGEALPVMVWIHGGGNVWGRSSAYDSSRLAANEKVVVVAVQHRLGPLGWFSHPLLRSAASKPEDRAASFATLDLIASLKWVRENISVFGGAPDNITIFGESAGGQNVVTLLVSPLARGLFQRAIVQSGSIDSISVAEAEGDAGSWTNPSKEIVKKLGVVSAEGLRALSLEELFAAYERRRGFLDVPRVIEDGVVLPAIPMRQALASPERFVQVPVMTGTNRDEMKLFYVGNPVLVKKVLGLLPVPRDQALYDAVTGYISRVWRIRSVDEPAAAMVRAGHGAVYAYRFDWDDGGKLLSMDFRTLFGAAHGFELPFVFGKFEHLGDADRILFQRRTAEERERLSRQMGSYWASFARDGVPSSAIGPTWPAYGGQAAFLRFDTESDGGIEVVEAADSLGMLIDDLMEDPRIDDDGRCRVVEEMRKWMFTRPILGQLRAATGCR